ncbi:hypothetical protein DC31_01020 [Microbacterium sp. CH12i]|nr:hypothetical protein DC31_01020 [Microbacterium sp. CH12i]
MRARAAGDICHARSCTHSETIALSSVDDAAGGWLCAYIATARLPKRELTQRLPTAIAPM